MGEEDAHPLQPALENDVQQKTKTQLCPGSLLPMHEAGCPPWKTLGDQGFQYHMALKGDSRGKMFSRRPVKTRGLLLWAAGQAPSAPTKPPPGFTLLLRKRWRSRSPSATARHSPPSPVQKTPNTEILQGWCREQNGARRDWGRQGCRLPSQRQTCPEQRRSQEEEGKPPTTTLTPSGAWVVQ